MLIESSAWKLKRLNVLGLLLQRSHWADRITWDTATILSRPPDTSLPPILMVGEVSWARIPGSILGKIRQVGSVIQ